MWTYRHPSFNVHQIPALRDNYIYIIEDRGSDTVCIVDPALADEVILACRALQLKPTHILNTHHHWDHTDGNAQLVQTFACEVVGNAADAERIPHISMPMTAHDKLHIGALNIQTLDVPGHTLGHIAFVLDDALFCGDTLFGAGCGRIFEGTYEQMWHSLQTLAKLPDETAMYCAHEYTLVNLQFAQNIDPNNQALQTRYQHCKQQRKAKQPTIPSTLGEEKRTNPFLRPLSAEFRKAYSQAHHTADDALSVFTHIRQARNQA